ncbi:MAG: ATP-binding cassette domain-containing protein [Chloroflexota bacterium]|nr:ATP-binding cassette domain-containing protein [Chloroflexota bacterium]
MTIPTPAAPPPSDETTAPLLELRHVRKVFGGGSMFKRREVTALDDFSLCIDAERPSITAVVGESGSGKTTMARMLLGLEQPSSGEVLYRGTELRQLSKLQWRDYRKNVQAIFQDPFGVYNSFYKVDHVLETPLRKFKLAGSRSEERRLMEQALRQVGLEPENTLGRYPHQLSGGQRQRTMVARTLLLRPRMIVADEPVSMIDASLRATVLGNLLQLKRQFGISLVYITHDLTTAYQISDRIIVLYQGTVVEAGEPEQIVRSPRHSYTQLLIRSIPEPDPDQHWGEDDDEEFEQEEEPDGALSGTVPAPGQ